MNQSMLIVETKLVSMKNTDTITMPSYTMGLGCHATTLTNWSGERVRENGWGSTDTAL